MKAQAGKSRAKHSAARKRTQTAPLTQMLVLDALRSWVMPAVAAAIGLVVFVVYNIGLVEEGSALTTIGGLALLVTLFFGLRSFLEESRGARLAAIIITFAALWSVATLYPFYRTLNPGTPLFTTELGRGGTPVTIPMHGQPGRYSLMVEGHFLPAEGRQNRTATYRIAVEHGGATERIVDGTFTQEWHSQRIGAGRRSSLVPVMSQSTQRHDTLDDADGHDLTLKLTDLSDGMRDSVTVHVYAEVVPQWLLVALGVVTLVGALLIDAWRPGRANEGLMTTLTVAAFVSIVFFRQSTASAPGFPQLIIAVLVGTLVGALGGALFWRLTRSLKHYLPALE